MNVQQTIWCDRDRNVRANKMKMVYFLSYQKYIFSYSLPYQKQLTILKTTNYAETS